MCFPCCPASAPANLCPLASMCSHVVHLRLCACLSTTVRATYVHTCVMSVFFVVVFFFTVTVLLSHCVLFAYEVSS